MSEQKTDTAGHQTIAQLLQQGLFHHRQGDIPTAMERYAEVLSKDPKNAEALYYVAVIACQEDQFKQGADLARRAISLGGSTARLHNLLGRALDRLGEPLEAVKNFDQAIALDPNLAVAHGNRANVLVDAKMPEEALKSFDRAIALDPNSLPDLINRGALLVELGRPEDALKDYDQALACDPTVAEVHSYRASVLARLGRFDEALIASDRAVALGPKFAPAHLQRGLTLKYLGRFDEAREAMQLAMTLDENDHAAACALSQLLLLTGNWDEGLPLLERRASLPQAPYRPLDYPRWSGEEPGDYRLVVLSEQGLDDNIQFGRYAALLATRGYPVTLLTREELAPLMRSMPGIETVITSAEALAGDKRPVRWVPLMSLSAVLQLGPDTIPAQKPYLSAEPERIAKWADKLGPQGFKIGIAWQGSTWLAQAPLAAFAPLAEIPGVRLISLQKGTGAAQIDAVPFGANIERVSNESKIGAEALLDTAAIMQNLELVVSIDGIPAHLASATGRPVFVALRDVPEWRWLLNRDDSPWYPAMRLFRQDATRDWGPVFARITAAVRERMA